VTGPVAAASIRRRRPVPLRFADGYATSAHVVSFTSAAGRTGHRALRQARRVRAAGRGPGHLRRERRARSPGRRALGASRIRLLSNNPDKGAQLARLGVTIEKQVATGLHLTEANAAYLAAKARRGGHGSLSRALDRTAERRRRAGITLT
jgi:hypothetical protein